MDQRTECGTHRGRRGRVITLRRRKLAWKSRHSAISASAPTKLDDWTDFATGWLGMQAVDRGAGVRAFRMDDRRQRLVIDRSLAEGERYFGWEVADAAALDALAARLEAAGVAVRREPAALADQRFVSGLISFADPSGNRLEAFHGAQVADEPFRPAARFPASVPVRSAWAMRC